MDDGRRSNQNIGYIQVMALSKFPHLLPGQTANLGIDSKTSKRAKEGCRDSLFTISCATPDLRHGDRRTRDYPVRTG